MPDKKKEQRTLLHTAVSYTYKYMCTHDAFSTVYFPIMRQ